MLKLLLGDPNARKLKRYHPIVSDINLLEEEIAPLTDGQLREKTKLFQERLAQAGSLANQRPILDEILPEAFALSLHKILVIRRSVRYRHYLSVTCVISLFISCFNI